MYMLIKYEDHTILLTIGDIMFSLWILKKPYNVQRTENCRRKSGREPSPSLYKHPLYHY